MQTSALTYFLVGTALVVAGCVPRSCSMYGNDKLSTHSITPEQREAPTPPDERPGDSQDPWKPRPGDEMHDREHGVHGGPHSPDAEMN